MPQPKPAACAGCPAFKLGKGFVLATVPPNPEVIFLGSGPSSDEYLDSKPFVGRVGRKFDYWLTASGKWDTTKQARGHVVQCQLPYEKGAPRPPKPAEIEFCRKAHWGVWFDAASQKLVVPVGTEAMRATISSKLRAKDVGIRYKVGTTNYLPIQSPTWVLNGNWSSEPAQIAFLKHAKDILDGRAAEAPNFSEPPPGVRATISPQLDDLARWKADLDRSDRKQVVVDIETAGDHIRLVGLFDIASRSYLGFPIRTVGGGNYWPADQLATAVSWLWELLADPAIGKTFHNGISFDIPMLERNGFEINGVEFDTLLAAHIAYPGVPKGLEELSKVHLRAGGWKGLVKVDEDKEEYK